MDKLSSGYIETVAKNWCEKCINDAKSAEEEINRMGRMEIFFRKIKRIFGIETKLTSKQKQIAELWCNQGYSDELLELASDKTIDRIGKLSFAYTDKILSDWKEKGYTTKIIWWNFNSRNVTVPEMDTNGNIYMSGYSPMLLKFLGAGFDGKMFLDNLLNEYKKAITSK
jgi:DnaD/phage-associated family protein